MAPAAAAPLAGRPAAAWLAAALAGAACAPLRAGARTCNVQETNSQGLAGLEEFSQACPTDCPVAVYPFGNICTGLCVANLSQCGEVNRHATLRVGNVCKACSEFPEHILTGASVCQTCHEDEAGRMVCDSCFKGFQLRNNACIIESEEVVFDVVYAIAGIIGLSLLAAMVLMVWRKLIYVFRGVKRLCTGLPADWGRRSPTGNREILLDAETNDMDDDDDSEGSEVDEREEEMERADQLIARAVNHGKHFAMKSSISTNVKDGVIKGNMANTIGLGIPLFFHSQFFLIIASAVSLYMIYSVESDEWFQELVTWVNSEKDSKCSNFELAEIRHLAVMHGEAMASMCAWLWVALLLMSWAFVAWSCFYTISHYDKAHATFEDYTVELRNVPRWVTSEDKFLQILKEKYPRNANDFYGVAIVYDIKHVEEQLREKLDRLVEYDDAKYEWCGKEISANLERLEQDMGEDKQWLETLLRNGPNDDVKAVQKIEGSGTAFVIFKTQKAMQLALRTIRGIQFEDRLRPFFGRAPPREGSTEHRDAHGIEDTIIEVVATRSEPPGICWYYFNIPQWRFAMQVAGVYVGSFTLFLFFAYVSQIIYYKFMKPYTDANVPPDQADAALQIAGNLVGVVNALIQMVVQEMAKGAGYTKFAEMDRCVYHVNTVIVILNFATQLFFFTWRGGFNMNLRESTNHDLTTEVGFGRNMLAFMVPNLLFVQYVLNEILTAGLPTLLNWFILKMVYVWRFGPPCFRRALLGALPLPPLRMAERKEDISEVETRLPGRVAEQALMFPELLLSLEYTFIVVYPMAAFSMLFFVTDAAHYVFIALTIFAVVFYLWQRFVNFWMLRVTMHDSPDVWWGNVNFWGVPLSMVSTASVWWFLRVNADLAERFHSMTLILVVAFGASFGIYALGVFGIHAVYRQSSEGLDYQDVRNRTFDQVMKDHDYNWWNTNPLYVLRHRHCPNLPGYECHKAHVKCWSDRAITKGFYESGKGFRLRRHPASTHHRMRSGHAGQSPSHSPLG